MSLFTLAPRGEMYDLHSGKQTDWKIECDALSNEDWRALARLARSICKPYTNVLSVPRGGNMLALYLRADGPPVGPSFPTIPATKQHWLIADDVCTTGNSFLGARNTLLSHGIPAKNIEGVCVFARGPYPSWVKPIFRLWGVE